MPFQHSPVAKGHRGSILFLEWIIVLFMSTYKSLLSTLGRAVELTFSTKVYSSARSAVEVDIYKLQPCPCEGLNSAMNIT